MASLTCGVFHGLHGKNYNIQCNRQAKLQACGYSTKAADLTQSNKQCPKEKIRIEIENNEEQMRNVWHRSTIDSHKASHLRYTFRELDRQRQLLIQKLDELENPQSIVPQKSLYSKDDYEIHKALSFINVHDRQRHEEVMRSIETFIKCSEEVETETILILPTKE